LSRKSSRSPVLIASILLWIALVVQVWVATDYYQWDFEAYYTAVKALSAGLNPYDPSKLRSLARKDVFEFLYFPTSIVFLKPFTLVTLQTAKHLFLVFKCCLLIFLLVLWQNKFLENSSDPFFLLFCLLGFNAAICMDLESGNISLVEQALIWSAFFFYVRGKILWFCLLIPLAAVFKLTPLMLGAILLVYRKWSGDRPIVILLGLTCLMLLVTGIVAPQLVEQFFVHVPGIAQGGRDIGIRNPATFSLIKYLSLQAYTLSGKSVPIEVQVSIYFIAVAVVFSFTWAALRNLDAERLEDRKTAVYLVCLAYALVLPRFQDYQWILLLVPTYALMLRQEYLRAYPALFLFSALSVENLTLPALAIFFSFLWNYYPWFLGVAVWAMYLSLILKSPGTDPPTLPVFCGEKRRNGG